jgi:hypothetical protein
MENEEPVSRFERRQGKGPKAGGSGGGAVPDCASMLKLKTSGGGKGGHMGYNADGT